MERIMPPSGGSLGDCFRLSIQELLVASAYPHPVTRLVLRQTHLSWIVLTGRFAYKIKKPVRFDFIDASTLERRRSLCDEELRLNRRFAPELYVDVVPITRAAGGLQVNGPGQPIEYAVRMHEFDASQELAACLDKRAVTTDDMCAIAERLADAHVRAAVATANGPFGTFDGVRQPMLDNFSLLRTHLRDPQWLKSVERLESWTSASLARLRPIIELRRQSGMVRECHGDLHARNIVRWQQQWLAFDCLEFDPHLRWIDVINDAGCLYMDLVSRSRQDLAQQLLSRYLETTGDYECLRLLPIYAAYRALVRAKVDALSAETMGPEDSGDLQTRLMRRLEAAARFMDAAPAALVIMHGVTASGKSWLSERLIGAIRAVRVRSDLERKRLAGVTAFAHRALAVSGDSYSAAATRQTYDRLLACAEAALDGRCSIVVDATFLDRKHREAFRSLANRRRCPFLIVSCRADSATLAARLDARARGGLDPSEATHEVLDQHLRYGQPLSPEEKSQTVEIDTSRLMAGEGVVERIRSRLESVDRSVPAGELSP